MGVGLEKLFCCLNIYGKEFHAVRTAEHWVIEDIDSEVYSRLVRDKRTKASIAIKADEVPYMTKITKLQIADVKTVKYGKLFEVALQFSETFATVNNWEEDGF